MRARIVFALAALCGLAAVPGRARAANTLDDPYDVPNAPRSISIPELTHPDVEWGLVSTLGELHTITAPPGGSHVAQIFTQRLAVELPIGLRRWFAGATYELAAGSPPVLGGNTTIAGGNIEVYGRTVWATRTGLAFGGGIGLIPALASYSRSGTGAAVALAASTVQPWDNAFFQPGLHTLRSVVDVRDLVGQVVIQFRQIFDWSIYASDTSELGLSASSMLYLGYLATPLVGVGVEASEHYFIYAPVSDVDRAHFVVAPSVRLITKNIQPAVSAFMGVGNPLHPEVDRMWGVRLALTFVWDPRKSGGDEP